MGAFFQIYFAKSIQIKYYIFNNIWICIKILAEACRSTRDRPPHSGDDPDYDRDSGSASLSGLLGGGLHFLECFFFIYVLQDL